MEQLSLAVLVLHTLWLMFVIFGALITRGRRALTVLHLAGLFWGILVEVGPWPCPLTLLELALDRRAGIAPYGGGCLAHGVNTLLYPNLPDWVITALGVGVCGLNLLVYLARGWAALQARRHRADPTPAGIK